MKDNQNRQRTFSSPNKGGTGILQMPHLGIIAAATLVLLALVAVIGGYVIISQLNGQSDCGSTGPVCGIDGKTYGNACLAWQAGTEIKTGGSCAACTDSDGGRDIFTYGNARSGTAVVADGCDGTDNVNEAVCSGDAAASAKLPCPAGYECSGGACVESTCTDSDGGRSTDEKGTTTYRKTPATDECVSENTVREFYCEDDQAQSAELLCGSGKHCADGACEETPCVDSDGGNEISVAGNVTSGGKTYSDACVGENVKEYYCSNGMVEYAQTPCQAGYACSGGRCELDVCTDSDHGQDQFTKGTTTYGTQSNTDSCYSTTKVVEHFCSSATSISTVTIACGSGYECKNGMCGAAECVESLEELDDEDERRLIAEMGSSDEVRLAEEDIVELNDGYLMELYSISGDSCDFRLYEDIGEYRDADYLCSFSIDNESSGNDFCGESVTTVRVVDLDSEFATIEANELNAVEFFSQSGEVTNWTDSDACDEDVYEYDEFSAEFFPYIDTNSSGLDLDDEEIRLFDGDATIRSVGIDSVRIYLDSTTYTLEDGETIEYKDQDYMISLTFSDLGLKMIEIEPD